MWYVYENYEDSYDNFDSLNEALDWLELTDNEVDYVMNLLENGVLEIQVGDCGIEYYDY